MDPGVKRDPKPEEHIWSDEELQYLRDPNGNVPGEPESQEPVRKYASARASSSAA